MTDPDIIKECRQTGRTRTTTEYLLKKAYYEQMTEKEQLKAQIQELQEQLQKLEEISPVEIAYKDAYGKYPVKVISEELTSEDNWNVISWSAFQKGYITAQKDYKVEEPEELKTLYQIFTLYQMLRDEECRDDVCYVVKEWMSQYADNVLCGEYKKGYEYCLTVLEENLK
jgi:uncharacterized membrane protein YheB (UPF0754 family)